MQLELIVAIIGAGAAILGALISTASIILTNKNTKALHLLENSKNVKSDIAEKRYIVYKNIIEYIDSWYKIKQLLNHDYVSCPARKHMSMAVFEHRLHTLKDIEDEFEKVSELCNNYFYLDSKTYITLNALKNYLSSVITCAYNEKIDNFKFFSYVVYCDIWKYMFIISKSVNKFLKSENVLKFKPSKDVEKKDIFRLYEKTDFYCIYDRVLKREKYYKQLKSKIEEEIENYNKRIEEIKANVNDVNIPEYRDLMYERIKTFETVIEGFKKIKSSNRLNKIKYTNTYYMWKICQKCKNSNCVLNPKNEK